MKPLPLSNVKWLRKNNKNQWSTNC